MSKQWFACKGRQNFDQYARGLPVSAYLEIGVFQGDSLFWVLDELRPKIAVGVDPYFPDRKYTAETMAGFRADVERRLADYPGASLVATTSRAALPALASSRCCFDLVYVDGSHAGPDVLFDMVLGWELLRPGGLMICDDWVVRRLENVLGLRDAVASFARIHARTCELAFHNCQVGIRRRLEPGEPDAAAVALADKILDR